MDVDILVDHLADRVVIAHLRGNQVISCVHAHVWLLRIHIALDEHSKSATVSSDNESLLARASSFTLSRSRSSSVFCRNSAKSGHRMNWEEVLPGVTHGHAFVLTLTVEQEDLTMVVADYEAAIIEPSMTGVIVRVVRLSLSFSDNDGQSFHCRSVEFDVPVELDACDYDNARIDWTERNLLNRLTLGNVGDHLQRANASLLLPMPDDDTSLGLSTDSDEQFLILTAKVCRYELLGLVLI